MRPAAVLLSIALLAAAGVLFRQAIPFTDLGHRVATLVTGTDKNVSPAANSTATAPMPKPAPPVLANVLADPSVPTGTDVAFESLFTRWGLKFSDYHGSTGCERAVDAGLRCLFESGTWNNLRQLNRPAIIELVDSRGTRHHVLVSRLGERHAVFDFGGKEFEFSLTEIDRLWFGKYLLVWRPPETGDRPVRRGMRGPAVAWVRDALVKYGLEPDTRSSGAVFDSELEGKVKEFQRRHQLNDDGVVGKMTLIYLRTYDSNAHSPQLNVAGPVAAVR